MDYANYWASATATADLGDTINQSIRLRLNNSVLSSTLAATPSSSTITVSFWFKSIGTRDTNIFRYFYGCGNHAILNQGYLLTVYNTTGAASSIRGSRDAFTDPSAWYHFVGQYSSGSYKLWVNGVQWSTTTIGFSPSTAFRIGGWNLSGGDNDGNRGLYLADFHFLDGTAKDETDFGKYNDDGVWVPIAPSFTAAEYGAGGFHLTFDSSQSNATEGIGEDSAPIGASGHTARNDFTSTDIDSTAISSSNTDNDVDYNDTPTSNYATYNPLVNNDEPTFNQANLDGDSFNNGIAWATQELPDEHLYCEFVRTAGDRFAAGVWDAEDEFEKGAANDNDYAFGIVYSEYGGSNRIFNESTTASQTGLTAYSTGDVLGVEWRGDLATRQVNFYINGTQVGTSENVAAGGRYYFGAHRAGGSTGPSVQVNFGQMPFVAAPTGVSNTTHGMQSNNLPEPTIMNGSDHFRALTGTGANILAIAQGTNTSGTNWNDDVNTGFTNGLWWIKDRANSNQHQLVDSVRGTTNQTIQNPSGGYENAYSAPSGSSVAWCWKYNSSDVSENGFNIIEFTGADNDPQTIDTGLTNPQFVMYVSDAGSSQVKVQHASYQPGLLELHSDSQGVGYSACTFSGGNVNIDGALISGSGVMYAWEPVEGFSKFGSYDGNDNADGVFVYLGFRPAMIILKTIGLGYDWFIWDTTRDTNNPSDTVLKPNLTQDETTASSPAQEIDILSNGFKIRGANQVNQLTNHIYCAWAENPFGGENQPPATAR